ncbi:MAG: LysR family transcriptional regulator [Thermoleophilia bacterium]|nr:LysR family transcriptional regulator [Thermoleophilia bacterium]
MPPAAGPPVATPADGGHPTPHELRAFLVLADELHFGRAAVALGVAQSSLSEVIRRLEARVGVVLLERTSRRVALTPAGIRLLAPARRVLHELTTLRSALLPAD